ncbi:MAG TPA: hypothetical protein VGM06_24645 [Polyangiaceae bacterium]|jgi:hypothetical protein
MGTFDRKYREPLQAVVDHARRLCAFLERLEARHPDPERWLVGRRDEIRLVVRLRVRDWRTGRIGLEYAARTIGAYLDELHLGAARSLGLPANGPLDCCATDEAITLPLGAGRRPATHVAPQGSRSVVASETWLDLRALLDLEPSGSRHGEPPPERNADPGARREDLPEPRVNRS